MHRYRNETVPSQPSPEEPPLAPYDPPEPAPQAIAWRRALKVVLAQGSRQPVESSRARHYA
jgi:hypothetical protein